MPTTQVMGKSSYRSFLVRCSLEESDQGDSPPVWRYMVFELERKGHRRAFASLDALMSYLRAELEERERIQQ